MEKREWFDRRLQGTPLSNPKYLIKTEIHLSMQSVQLYPQVIWVTYVMAGDSCAPSLWRTGSLHRDTLPAVSHTAIAGSAGSEHRCTDAFFPSTWWQPGFHSPAASTPASYFWGGSEHITLHATGLSSLTETEPLGCSYLHLLQQ